MVTYTYAPPRRWCPNCESPGTPIVWGYPSSVWEPLVESGLAVLGGCIVGEDPPSHVCEECGANFSGVDRRYAIERKDGRVQGVGVWPHGRRSVRIEGGVKGHLVVTADGVGSLLIPTEGIGEVLTLAWHGMSRLDLIRWASTIGAVLEFEPSPSHMLNVSIRSRQLSLVLLSAKKWWRTLGDPMTDVVDKLDERGVDVIWLRG